MGRVARPPPHPKTVQIQSETLTTPPRHSKLQVLYAKPASKCAAPQGRAAQPLGGSRRTAGAGYSAGQCAQSS